MTLSEILSNHKVSFEAARSFVEDCVAQGDVRTIFDTAKAVGITNSMLAELYGRGVTGSQVQSFFTGLGYDGNSLDAQSSNSSFKVLSDATASQLADNILAKSKGSAFATALVDRLKTSGADLDMDGMVEFGNESSLYAGSNGELATAINYVTNLNGKYTVGAGGTLTQLAAQGVSMVTKLQSSAGTTVESMYSTQAMRDYYALANQIAEGGTWTSSQSAEVIGATALDQTYAYFGAYGFIFVI